MTNPALIQIGDNTHHHDHAMTLQSFRVMNTMVRRPAKPIPPDVLLFVLLMVVDNSKDAQQAAAFDGSLALQFHFRFVPVAPRMGSAFWPLRGRRFVACGSEQIARHASTVIGYLS